MGSPRDGANGDLSSAVRGTRRNPMISGDLMARIARATRGNVDLVHGPDALIEDLGRDITARLREDPPGDVSDLMERYLDLCDAHMKVFRSLDTLSAYLKAFQKELADLSAATAAAEEEEDDDSSVGGAAENDCDRSSSTLSSFLDTF